MEIPHKFVCDNEKLFADVCIMFYDDITLINPIRFLMYFPDILSAPCGNAVQNFHSLNKKEDGKVQHMDGAET